MNISDIKKDKNRGYYYTDSNIYFGGQKPENDHVNFEYNPDIEPVLYIEDFTSELGLCLYKKDAQKLYEFLNHLACEGELEI